MSAYYDDNNFNYHSENDYDNLREYQYKNPKKDKSYLFYEIVAIISALLGFLMLPFTLNNEKRKKMIIDGIIIGLISKTVIGLMILWYLFKFNLL